MPLLLLIIIKLMKFQLLIAHGSIGLGLKFQPIGLCQRFLLVLEEVDVELALLLQSVNLINLNLLR